MKITQKGGLSNLLGWNWPRASTTGGFIKVFLFILSRKGGSSVYVFARPLQAGHCRGLRATQEEKAAVSSGREGEQLSVWERRSLKTGALNGASVVNLRR